MKVTNIKIIATLGPSSMNQSSISRMSEYGVDLFRINLSHTDADEFEPLYEKLKKWTSIEICPDTEGAQLRTKLLNIKGKNLQQNTELTIFGGNQLQEENQIGLNIDKPERLLIIGDVLTIDFDGAVVQVIELMKNSFRVRVLKSGYIQSNKGIGIDRVIDLPEFSSKDKKIFKVANKLNIKTIFLSFCSTENDIIKLRKHFDYEIKIIAKIENKLSLLNLDEICLASDGILIDRGDLSRDIQIEKIAFAQKYIINKAKENNTSVYVATNLMENMILQSQPTRAEINDIVSTINNGVDGLVLAAETAIGKYPVDSVRILSNVIYETEKNKDRKKIDYLFEKTSHRLNEPHGGKLINQYYDIDDLESFNDLPSIKIDQKLITDVIQICQGTYSPLTNFMNIEELKSVLDNYQLLDGLVWSLPIIFQIKKEKLNNLPSSGLVKLIDQNNNLIAVLDIYKIDYLEKVNDYLIKWFGTNDLSHPGISDFNNKGDYIISGKPYLLKNLGKIYCSPYELTPQKTRSIFHENGWHNIIGFHTRNVPHKGHEYIQKNALLKNNADALFISPVVGLKKKGDFSSNIIINCYRELIKDGIYEPYKAIIGAFNTYSRYCGPREAVFTAICRKNYGCSHFIIGRDHTGVGNYYNDNSSKKIIEDLDIGIELIKFDEVVYDNASEQYIEVAQNDKRKNTYNKISGSIVREKLLSNDYFPDYLISKKIGDLLNNSLNNDQDMII